jgi:hypothetical protein
MKRRRPKLTNLRNPPGERPNGKRNLPSNPYPPERKRLDKRKGYPFAAQPNRDGAGPFRRQPS